MFYYQVEPAYETYSPEKFVNYSEGQYDDEENQYYNGDYCSFDPIEEESTYSEMSGDLDGISYKLKNCEQNTNNGIS